MKRNPMDSFSPDASIIEIYVLINRNWYANSVAIKRENRETSAFARLYSEDLSDSIKD